MNDVQLINDDDKWQAVLTRDAAHDGEFLYGVTTTGVFCRPSCPSRRPKRENVRFYAHAKAAITDGLRPCRRCRPLQDTGDAAGVHTLLDLCRHIDAHPDEVHSLAALGERVGLSTFQVHRLFKRMLGLTPKQYADAARLRTVKHGLRAAPSVTEAIYDAGYGSGSRLYERVDTRLGMTPQQYRRGGAGVAISFAFGRTPLGLTLIGATDRGVCFLQFGDSQDALLVELTKEYPNATLAPMPAPSPQFDTWMAALAAHLEGRRPGPALPLDVHGTAFQLKVWDFLQRIPRGEVMSYAEVAQAIGMPKATRAVANACAHNRIGVLIPCHRVIRGNGELGGYRWGLPRKRALLDAERRHRADRARV